MGKRRKSAMQVLRERLVPDKVGAPYFSINHVEAWLAADGARVSRDTLRGYMHDLMQAGQINGAGRGWYTFLKDRPVLDTQAVAPLVETVRARFPLLRMVAWSTVQVNPWMHHLIGTPTHFLSVEKDAMGGVAEFLAADGWRVALNPRDRSAEEFVALARGVVIRPLHHRSPKAPGGLAEIEQLLVELRLEAVYLGLMDVVAFRSLAESIILKQLVYLGNLIDYARRRQLGLEEFVGHPLA